MFSSADLVTAAKARFGDAALRERMRGATDSTTQNVELRKIAAGVISRIESAARGSGIGWPLPGSWPEGSVAADGTTDVSGELYANLWPGDLLQNALDLFNWRTLSGWESVSDAQRRVGKAAEDFFSEVESGGAGFGLAVIEEPSSPMPLAARNRDGTSNLAEVPDQENTLDTFAGRAWDG